MIIVCIGIPKGISCAASDDPSRITYFICCQIDAALDTHKVRRVAAMLADRARSGNEQCIVISHRPEMQERGR